MPVRDQASFTKREPLFAFLAAIFESRHKSIASLIQSLAHVKMTNGTKIEKNYPTRATSDSLDAFHGLVHNLNHFLASSRGSSFLDIDPKHIIAAMAEYTSQRNDWEKYAHKNGARCFTRNLVDPGNGKHNLVCQSRAQGGGETSYADDTTQAHSGLDSREGEPHPRPRRVTLCYEGTILTHDGTAER